MPAAKPVEHQNVLFIIFWVAICYLKVYFKSAGRLLIGGYKRPAKGHETNGL